MISSLIRNPIYICFIVLFSYGFFLWGASVPMTGDQKVYLSIALEMFEKKNWMIPSLFGEPNFLKPPFQYWATLIGWKVFGLSLFGALIPSVLALVGSAFFCSGIAKHLKLKNPSLATLFFSATLGSMTYGSTSQMEIWVVFFILASWWAVLVERLFLAYLLVGLMAWVKGPLYPALWTISFLVWKPRSVKRLKFWVSLLVGILIGLSWYLLAAVTHHEEMMRQFFYVENLGKLNTHQGTIYGLWGEFFASLLPWAAFILVGALQPETRSRWKQNLRFYCSFAIVSAVFFTFFPYRVYSYLYFLTPLAAMLVSEVDFQLSRKIKFIAIGFYGVLFISLFAVIHMLQMSGWVGIWIEIFFIFSSSLFLFGLMKGKSTTIALASLLIVTLVRIGAVQIGEQDFSGLKRYVSTQDQKIAYFIDQKDIWHEYGLVSAILQKPVTRLYDQSSVSQFLLHGGAVIFQDDQSVPPSSSIQCTNWMRLKKRAKFPFERLMTKGVKWGDPEIMRRYQICFQST